MATQETDKVYWIGFTDEVCIVAKRAHWAINHLDHPRKLMLFPSKATVHLVGRWWNTDYGVEIRYALLGFRSEITFVKHLTPRNEHR